MLGKKNIFKNNQNTGTIFIKKKKRKKNTGTNGASLGNFWFPVFGDTFGLPRVTTISH